MGLVEEVEDHGFCEGWGAFACRAGVECYGIGRLDIDMSIWHSLRMLLHNGRMWLLQRDAASANHVSRNRISILMGRSTTVQPTHAHEIQVTVEYTRSCDATRREYTKSCDYMTHVKLIKFNGHKSL